LVDVSTFACPSTATHSWADGQETDASECPASIAVSVHAPAPAVGSVEVNTSPPFTRATHSETDGHEMPLTEYGFGYGGYGAGPGAGMKVHELAPPVGFVDVRMPAGNDWAATHRDVDGHEIGPIGPIGTTPTRGFGR
jgi:hypothetical protein